MGKHGENVRKVRRWRTGERGVKDHNALEKAHGDGAQVTSHGPVKCNKNASIRKKRT